MSAYGQGSAKSEKKYVFIQRSGKNLNASVGYDMMENAVRSYRALGQNNS